MIKKIIIFVQCYGKNILKKINSPILICNTSVNFYR